LTTRWQLRDVDDESVRALARDQGLSEPVARLLVGRGHAEPTEVASFLEASLHALNDPLDLPDMPAAAGRVARAIREGETILVHGDYDVDGLAGTAILMRLLRLLGARAAWHVPNRLQDGYSFGEHSVRRAQSEGAGLVVSVDNGTSSVGPIAELRRRGIDTVITDHHEPPEGDLPPAVAIVNPKLASSRYPFRELCGSGVAYKLAWALAREITGAERVREDLRAFLLDATSLVALATVCDVVPLVSENRVLARWGLLSLQGTRHPGLEALLGVCGLLRRTLTAEDVGFQLGPRLNAAGRLGSAHLALELLLCDDGGSARQLAVKLDSMNVERRAIEGRLLEEALEQAEASFRDAEAHPFLVLAGQGWHQGVAGIVAARLAERFARPALVIGLDGEAGRGSARSVPGFDVLRAMEGGAAHMRAFGGHADAAGCEVAADRVDALREAICARTREMLGGGGHPDGELLIDYDLPLGRMTPELMREIDRLEPFGRGNERPVLLSSDLRLAEQPRVIGKDERHLAIRVRKGEVVYRALAFGKADRRSELRMGEPLHVVYTPRWNTWRGETNLELLVHDFRCGRLGM